MIKKIVSILLLLCIVYSSASPQLDPCVNTNEADLTCEQQGGFCGNSYQCTITSYSYWDNVAISPPIPSTEYRNSLKLVTYESGTHTFTFTKAECVQVITFNFSIPQYVVTQPKCIQSSFNIRSPNLDPNDYAISLDTNNYYSPASGATGTYYSDVVWLYVRGASGFCAIALNVQPLNPVFPQLQFIKPTCGQANGKIIVTNYQQFSSLSLNLDGTPTNITAVKGVFSGLQISARSTSVAYKLSANSDLCNNTFVLEGNYYSLNPTIAVRADPISTTSCNNTHTYVTFNVIGLPSLSSNNVTVNGANVTIGSKNIYPYGEFDIYYYGDECETYLNYGTTYHLAPVEFSSTPTYPTCATNATITFSSPYSGFNYSTVTVKSSLYGNIGMNSNHQVQRAYGEALTIIGECDAFLIDTPEITPIFNVTYDSGDCGGNFTVIVQNYQLFDILELNSPINTVQAMNGKFINVWMVNYDLVYRVVGCSENGSITGIPTFNPSVILDTSFLSFDVQTVSPRTQCNESYALINVTAIYKGMTSTETITVNVTDSMTTVDVPFVHPRCPNANSVQFSTTQYNHVQSKPKVTFISKPRCKSSWGLIKLESNISYVYVGLPYFGLIPKRDDGIYALYPENPFLTLYYECGQATYYFNEFSSMLIPTEPNSEVPYTLTPQSTEDCNVRSGGVQIDPSQFTFAQLDGANATNGKWTDLGSSIDSSSLTYIHNYCGVGVASVLIPTANDLKVTTQVLKPASCYDIKQRGDAIAALNVSRNGVPMTISDVDIDNAYYNDAQGYLHGMNGGEKNIIIYLGDYCYVKKSFTVPTKVIGHAFKATLLQYPINSLQTGLIKIDPLYDGLDIYKIENYYGLVSIDNKYIFAFLVGFNLGVVQTTIQYNSYCYDYLYVNMTNPLQISPEPIITPPSQCGVNLATISFTQISLDNYYIFIKGYGEVTSTAGITVNTGVINYSFQDKNTMYNGNQEIIIDSDLSSPLHPVVTVTNETCRGSLDGIVAISGIDFSSNTVTLYDVNGNPTSSRMVGSSMLFENLPGSTYNLYIESPSNQFCPYHQPVIVENYDFVYDVLVDPICYDDQRNGELVSKGAITVTVDPPIYQVSISFNGVKAQGNLLIVDQPQNVIININATKGQCLYSEMVTYDVNTDVSYPVQALSTQCGSLTALMGTNGETVVIYNSDGKMVAQSDSHYAQDFYVFSGLPGGIYKVSYPYSGSCYTPAFVTVKECGETISPASTISHSLILTTIFMLISLIYLVL